MDKLNKKSIFFRLGIPAILALGIVIIIPIDTYAEGGYNYIYNTSSGFSNQHIYQAPIYSPAPIYYSPTPAPTIYSSSANPDTLTASKTVTTDSTNTSVAKSKTSDNNSLTASAIFGLIFGLKNGLYPSSLIQWILFAILVLLMVILVRKIYGGSEKYNAIPMKHK